MSDRTDFFDSGAGPTPAADESARTAFFASGADNSQSTLPARPLSILGAIASPITNIGASALALGENALSGITAGAGSLADAVTGSDPGTHNWAYRPRTPGGQAIATDVGKVS